MALLTDTGSVLAAVSGALLLLLAAFVLTVRPRRRSNVLLVVFAGGLGGALLLYHLEGAPAVGEPLGPLRLAALAAAVPAGIAAAGLALRLPRPLAPHERRTLALAAAVALLVGGVRVYVLLALDPGPWVGRGVSHLVTALVPGVLAALFILALRAPSFPTGAERRQAVMLSAALAPWPALQAGFNLAALSRVAAQQQAAVPASLLGTLSLGGALLLLAALWLRNVARVPAGEARGSRLLAHGLLLGALAGMASSIALGGSTLVGQAGITALTWLLTAALLAYAILRHQLLGLDVKVKWTVKQSTVAAAFVGVFFVASEGAASFFADTANSQYLGIAAAGLLVFALAPLQRAAEKVADAALPGVKATSQMSHPERLHAYREAARIAWSDGALSRDERAMLEGLRGTFGLSDAEAQGIERELAGAAG